jgi:hypothetical protein
MKRKRAQIASVSFKVEAELATLLDALPNKSEFIRAALVAQLRWPCPLCHGTGVVPRGLHDHFAPLIQSNAHSPCELCGTELTLVWDLRTVAPEDQRRWELFFSGGPLYCPACHEKTERGD